MAVRTIQRVSIQGGGNNTIHLLCSQDTLPENIVSAPAGSIYIYTGANIRIFQKTTTADKTGWRAILNNRHGTSASRPSLVVTDTGTVYFDTTIGRAIWWNGTTWLDPFAPATATSYGLVKQSTLIESILVPDATDAASAVVLANANKAKINEIITKLKAANIISNI